MTNQSSQENSNTGLQLFSFEQQEVRVVLVDGEPWWVAADVCKVLEISDTEVALRRLDDDEKLTRVVYGSGQNRKMWCVNESGIYHLIFTFLRENERRLYPDQKRQKKTHCIHGHPYDGGNTYTDPDGYRECRICRSDMVHRHREKLG